jgi:hypothetical protein
LLKALEALGRGGLAALQPTEALFNGPAGPALIDQLGDVAAKARQVWLDVASAGNALSGEAMRRKLDLLRQELEGPSPSPLERLLVERVLLCWLQVYQADVFSAQTRGHGPMESGQRLQGHAQARYLAAIRSLVTVRKLLRPPLSPVDLAARPVNEGTPAEAGKRRGVALGEVAVEN